MITDFFFRPQPCLSPDSARVTFFLRSGKISSPPSCKPPSPCINNVSTSTEESLFLRPGVGYKEESRCRNQERGAEVAPFSGGLLTEIGCLFNRSAPVSAGLGWDSASHSSRISSKKQTKKKQKKKTHFQLCSFMQFHHPHRGIFLPACCKETWAEIAKHVI